MFCSAKGVFGRCQLIANVVNGVGGDKTAKSEVWFGIFDIRNVEILKQTHTEICKQQ